MAARCTGSSCLAASSRMQAVVPVPQVKVVGRARSTPASANAAASCCRGFSLPSGRSEGGWAGLQAGRLSLTPS